MKRFGWLFGLVLVVALFIWLAPAGMSAEDSPTRAALYRLQNSYPGVMPYEEGPRVTRLYGKPMGFGSSPANSADKFRQDFAQVFGVDSGDLSPLSILNDGRHTQPVKFNSDTGEYEFTLVYYSQYKAGLPVFRE